MSLDLCILASGSGGNCSVVRSTGGAFLVDCGLPPKVVSARLRGTGVELTDVSAVCVTHLDRDHFSPFFADFLSRTRKTIFCAFDCVEEVTALSPGAVVVGFDAEPFEVLQGVSAVGMRVAHDRTGSQAFRFDSAGAAIGYATDLGHFPKKLIDRFCGVGVLAIESNYDPDMQAASSRPDFVKQRITGGRGHLSNGQAYSAVQDLMDQCRRTGRDAPRQIALLHRSRQCNCPHLLRRTFTADPRLDGRVILSDQHRRTDWISTGITRPSIGEQLVIKF